MRPLVFFPPGFVDLPRHANTHTHTRKCTVANMCNGELCLLRCHRHRALSAIAAPTSPHDRGWWLTWDFCEIAPPSLLSAECSTSQSRPEQIKAAFLQGKVVDPMKDDFLILNVGVADLRGTGQRFYTFDHRRTYAMVRAGCLTARFRIRLRGPSFDEWLLGDCGFVAEQPLRATILIRVPKSRQHVCLNALVVDLNFEITAEVCEEGYLGAAGDPLRGVGAFLIIGSLVWAVSRAGRNIHGESGQKLPASRLTRPPPITSPWVPN